MGTTRIHTIGHSTHEVAEFIEILRAHGITALVDIRTIPKSRHNPQFNAEDLAASLEAADIGYHRAKELGGLRPTHKDSINGAWHNDSFRGYADYMQGDEFSAAIEDLLTRATHHDTAIMCAEAVPWRCHRSLVGDALLVRGAEVLHIISRSTAMPHTLTSFAHVEGTAVTYPPTAENPGPGQP